MGNPIDVRFSVLEQDITTPHATQKYPLGLEIKVQDADCEKAYVYVKAGAGLSATSVYFINPTAGVWITATPATSAVGKLFGVANVAFTNGYYGFLQVAGKTVITSAGATTQYNTGKMANGVITVTDEAGAAETASTIGVILNTLGGAGQASVLLTPKRATV